MGTYICSIEATLAEQEINNLVAVQAGGDLTEDEPAATAIADGVAAAWKLHVMPQLAVLYTLSNVTVRGLHTDGIIAVKPLSGAGGIGSQSLPTFAVAKVQFLSATPGRAGTGRTGLTGIPEPLNAADSVSVNTLAPAYVADLSTAIGAFRTAVAAISPPQESLCSLAVVSRYANKVKRAQPLVSPITSHKVLAKMGSRVSRLR